MFCASVICGLGVLGYVILVIAQFRSALRQTVIAMNDPEKLALFEQAAREDLLTLALVLTATLIVVAMLLAMGLGQIRAGLRTNQN